MDAYDVTMATSVTKVLRTWVTELLGYYKPLAIHD